MTKNTINIEIMFGDGGLGMMRDANVGDKIARIIENEFGLKYEIRFSTAGNIDVDYEELIANTFAAAHKKRPIPRLCRMRQRPLKCAHRSQTSR